MKHKTSELEGALLDAAVAKAEGYELDAYGDNRSIRENGGAPSTWKPSTLWEQGGPIIERECILLAPQTFGPGGPGATWAARISNGPAQIDATPLVAAMRAYVASKFGDEVDLPET